MHTNGNLGADSTIRIIGDVHGKIDEYIRIANQAKRSIALGDMGFKEEYQRINEAHDSKELVARNHFILPGNHDYYPDIHQTKGVLHGYGLVPWPDCSNIFFVRGGSSSVDKHLRTEGVDWFREEEMTYPYMGAAIDEYIRIKPRVMLSHVPPSSAVECLLPPGCDVHHSITTHGLQAMLEEHEPDIWIFGHMHVNREFKLDGRKTRFRCLDELKTVDIKVPWT